MQSVYDVNGLVLWSGEELRLRRQFTENLVASVSSTLKSTNPAWEMIEVEASVLMPRSMISPNYTDADVFVQQTHDEHALELVLRPETTPGSYAAARMFLDSHSGIKPPLCVWQMGKSFRREADQPSKHMRLKEFYQLEFQCIYTENTLNDYHSAVLEPTRKAIENILALPTRLVPSDRLPSYSEITMDIEIWNGDKWMEVASISRRNDFPGVVTFVTKKGEVSYGLKVVEIAIGVDRLIYNYEQRTTLSDMKPPE